MSDTKSGVPVFRIVLVVLFVGVVGSFAGVDWKSFLDKGVHLFSQTEHDRQICLSVTNLPPQDVTISWHAGIEDDTFTDLQLETWEHCEPTKTGDTWHLLVEKTRSGNTVCEATLVPPGTSLNARTATGTRDCSVAGVVP